MPELSGIDAAKQINQKRKMVIIATTANAMIEERNRCQEAGIAGFLLKPFTLDDLERALNESLKREVSESELKHFEKKAS